MLPQSLPGLRPFLCVLILPLTAFGQASLTPSQQAEQIFQATGVQGGIVVHLGCGDGHLTAALRPSQSYLVHGLDRDLENVRTAREFLRKQGVYGKVSVDQLQGQRLPYIDNFVNLVVAEDLGDVPMQEVMRVLCPNGVAYIARDGKWTKTIKPRPKAIDEWTHYLHSPSNNAVAKDSVVGPPRRLQWVGSPRYSRHHDRMSSLSAAVSAGGRMFYIFDEGTRVSAVLPPKWSLIARDAFNGTILWKRPIENWHSHLWPLKSGPAQLPRRLVASGDRVYVTLDINGPLLALDAATGKTVRTYQETKTTEEVILSDGVLFVLVNDTPESELTTAQKKRRGYNAKVWDEKDRKLVAVEADSGKLLWSVESRVLPVTLAVDDKRVIFHDGESVVSHDRKTGKRQWKSEAVARSEEIRGFYAPTLVLYEGVVLFSGGETAGKQTGSWYRTGKDTLTALDAKSGKALWTAPHPPSGYRSAEDLLVVDGLVWTGETTSGRAEGLFTGRDPKTGEVKRSFTPDVDTYWFHHRCYRSKATEKFLLTSRTGIEFVDISQKHWDINHWVRGACLYGIMPANGLVYAPQHPCACYMEAKLTGLNALAPAADGPRLLPADKLPPRLHKGPAYGQEVAASSQPGDWPTFRHDAARSGKATTSIPAKLKNRWQTQLRGQLTSPVIAEGKVFLAAKDEHTVHALDAETGQSVWHFTTGGQVDSPPTIYQGRVLFGSADGCVYCVRASDGALIWRFRAAPQDERHLVFEQLESVWPVHGSVLVTNDSAYCVAGRSMFLDGGLRLWRLNPRTGEVLSRTVLDDSNPAANEGLQQYVSWLNMPPALPDVLSCDGKLVYMRSQPFTLAGKRLPLEAMPRAADADRGAPPATQKREHAHLFSPTGFLDDSWFHRTYWMYGSRYVGGWCGYFLAGKSAPAGRILVFDEQRLYGFARKPKYYRWTTPIEHHLYAADKFSEAASEESLQADRKGKNKKPGAEFLVEHHWTRDIPLLARGMVLADGKLFVAGPIDLIDEEQALRKLNDRETQSKIAAQESALEGKSGGLLFVARASDGEKQGEFKLDTLPVFDGMAAAGGKLYLATVDGRVICLAGN